MNYERTHDTDAINITIQSKATVGELLDARQFIQAEIDSKTPTLEEPEAHTQQTGPACDSGSGESETQSDHEWSEWFNWSGGCNPVGECEVEVVYEGVIHRHLSRNIDWSNMHGCLVAEVTRYRVLLSSIPEGWSLSLSGILLQIPEGGRA